ncbi:MAG: hypothetical protein HY736_03770 [Verrucomicrobia bacterium]|nr:hypothetical protein [Verrucomicrobiota bacterium]
MSAAPKDRQPWPMKWIALAILLVIVPYTFLTLHYRKQGPAFRPYEDMKNRAGVIRLLSAGFQRIPLAAQRPADPSGTTAAATFMAPGGLPAELAATLVEAPLLPAEILTVSATPDTGAAQAYQIRFSCTLPDEKQQLAGAELYVKGGQIVITPTFERLAGQLRARTRENVVLITVPAGALKAGQYQVTLAGQRISRAWTLHVR